MGIDLRGGNGGMPKQFLHDPDIGSPLEKMSCIAVPESVRADRTLDAGGIAYGLDDTEGTLSAERSTPGVQEQAGISPPTAG